MKTINLILITLLFSVYSAEAINGDNNSDNSKMVRSCINVPESIKQKHKTEKITICFVVNEKGDVIEVNPKTKDVLAKKDLESQFLKLNFKELPACTTNTIDVNFTIY